MIHIKEAVIVEGRYDKAKLSSLCDALIVETNGFQIYRDAEKRAFIRRLAAERGVIVLTDSDNAGRQLRSYIASFLPKEQIRHAYIPDIYGKERRKALPAKEGKLGVEGVPAEVILQALSDAGVMSESAQNEPQFSPADLYALGLSGSKNSAERRKMLFRILGLPENLSTKQLLRWANTEEKRTRVLEALEKIRGGA